MMLKTPTKQKKVEKRKGAASNGALLAIGAIGVIALFGTVAAGGIIPTIDDLTTAPAPGPQYSCCDTGDGAACQPKLEKSFEYNGETYALLKSNIFQSEKWHTKPAGLVFGGNDFVRITGESEPKRIILNTSDETADYSGRWEDICGKDENGNNKDLIGIPNEYRELNGAPCYGLDNDQLIYVCGDTQETCSQNVIPESTPFDVYYRITKNGIRVDEPVPSPVSTWCPKPTGSTNQKPQEIIGVPTPGARKNLQLETFQIKQHEESFDWLGAWCKPAVYLYPTEKTTVNVKVEPKGKFTLTIPDYPKDGWTVTAYPDGKIESNNQTFPYLYYEAAIEDEYVHEPKEGFVVAQNELATLFNTMLPNLGLSTKETNEFSEYWLKALPESPYYFVGIIPQTQINSMAPLTISPKPDSLLRVSLYFKILKNNDLKVNAPQLTNFIRNGFTVTEWGGMIKTDKNHPFTCLM